MPIQTQFPIGFFNTGLVLPLDINFTVLADGALPSSLVGATWAVSGGVAVATPTYGVNKLTDGNMEAVGVTNWANHNTPTTKEKSTEQAHGGTQSLLVIGDAANEGARQAFATVNGEWYDVRGWLYSSNGLSTGLWHDIGGIQSQNSMAQAWTELSFTRWKEGSSANHNLYVLSTAIGATAHADDLVARKIDFGSMIATFDAKQSDVVAKAYWNALKLHAQGGILLNLDSVSNPQNYLIALVWRTSGATVASLRVLKCINGTLSEVFNAAVTYGANRMVEVRKSGTTYQFFYNNVQIGTDQTVSDATLVNNTLHGVLSTDRGNSLNRFFLTGSLVEQSTVYAGSSITTSSGPNFNDSYRLLTADWLRLRYPGRDFAFTNAAISGSNTWNQLARLETDILPQAPDMLLFDTANDNNRDLDQKALEAFIRRLRTERPACALICTLFPVVADRNNNSTILTPDNAATMARVKSVCETYNVTVVDYDAAVRDLVINEGHDLTEYFSDTVHPNAGGHALAASLVEAVLPSLVASGQNSGTLPAAQYDIDGEYQLPPTVLTGSDYDGRTGTWSDNGTVTSSGQAGATITYSGTMRSIGFLPNIGINNPYVEISIDGGAFFNVGPDVNGWEISASRGAHTVTLKVLSGTVQLARVLMI